MFNWLWEWKCFLAVWLYFNLFLGKHHSWFLPENWSLDFQLLRRRCTTQNNFSFFTSVRENVVHLEIFQKSRPEQPGPCAKKCTERYFLLSCLSTALISAEPFWYESNQHLVWLILIYQHGKVIRSMQTITFLQISCQNNDAYFQAISCLGTCNHIFKFSYDWFLLKIRRISAWNTVPRVQGYDWG